MAPFPVTTSPIEHRVFAGCHNALGATFTLVALLRIAARSNPRCGNVVRGSYEQRPIAEPFRGPGRVLEPEALQCGRYAAVHRLRLDRERAEEILSGEARVALAHVFHP